MKKFFNNQKKFDAESLLKGITISYNQAHNFGGFNSFSYLCTQKQDHVPFTMYNVQYAVAVRL